MRCVRLSIVAAVALGFVSSTSVAFAGHDDAKPFVCGTPTPPPVVQSTPKPVVRDHRRPTPVIVRDHRTSGGVIVRDHRDQGDVIVRDHRDQSNVIVRDHRSPSNVVVRDHRAPVFPERPTGYKVPVYSSQDTSRAPGGVVVTSHSAGPVIRDHRTSSKNNSGSSFPWPLPKPITVQVPF